MVPKLTTPEAIPAYPPGGLVEIRTRAEALFGPPKPPHDRGFVLDQAGSLINGDRAKDYGDATQNHQRIADLWSAILGPKLKGAKITAHEVALCMVGVKMARLSSTGHHVDSWVDMAGYAALGCEIAERTKAS